jgi:uncharacterized membrane protein
MFNIKTYTQLTVTILISLIFVKFLIVFTGRINFIIFALWSIPLLAFLPFLIKQSVKAYQSFCFILLIYFLLASLRVFGIDGPLLDTFEIILIIILFIHSIFGPKTIRANQLM